MRNLQLLIEYDGTRYNGWQRLGNSDKTIQGKIENVLRQMTGTPTEITGSGRTDAGTHARGQVANFKTDSTLAISDMQQFFLRFLPQDIIVKAITEMPERYHARYNAKAKQYSYYVWHHPIPSAFERHYSYHQPQKLDLNAMRSAAELLLGTHDFAGFSALKKTKKSTVRTLQQVTIEEEGSKLHFTFIGDGFLHKMVRILVGTLLEVGSGSRSAQSIEAVFTSKIRSEAGETVPAQGLFLDKVWY